MFLRLVVPSHDAFQSEEEIENQDVESSCESRDVDIEAASASTAEASTIKNES